MKKFLCGILMVPVCLWCGSNVFDEPNIQEILKDRCLERNEIQNVYTPEILFSSSAKCIQDGKYDQAADLYLVAVAYGYFDGLRVVDKTGQDVLETLKVNHFSDIDAKKRDQFAQVLRSKLEDMSSTCRFLSKLGRPNYTPRYMVDASKNPFAQGSNNGLIPHYNGAALWDQTRASYLRCSQ